MGFLQGSQFHLTVSLRYDPDPNEIPFWTDLFERVSRILWDATDATLSIGHVLIATHSLGGRDADIWVLPNVQGSNSRGARLWFPFESLDLARNHAFVPTTVTHELGHYLFDLHDEYDPTGDIGCVEKISTGASLMELYGPGYRSRWVDEAGSIFDDWDAFLPAYLQKRATFKLGQPSEFCHHDNHSSNMALPQNFANQGLSCWEYMVDDAHHNAIPYGLTAPATSGPVGRVPKVPPKVTTTVLEPVRRVMLVLSESPTLPGQALDLVKAGANFWIDDARRREALGVLTDQAGGTVALALSPVPSDASAQAMWRAAGHAAVDGLRAGGAAALGDTLRRAIALITAGGRAASQVVVLFSDGAQSAGNETVADVLPDLRAAGVRVHTIGLGKKQDAVLLANLALVTGGIYFAIDPDLEATAAAAAVTEAMLEIAGDSRENGGIVSYNPITAFGGNVDVADTEPPFDWEKPVNEGATPGADHVFRFQVPVTRGSTSATIGAAWTDSGGSFAVVVRGPDGAPVEAGETVRVVRGPQPYALFDVDDPAPGMWTVDVAGVGAEETQFRTIGFESHPEISFDVSAVQPHVRSGEDIELRARLRAPILVPGVDVVATVLPPGGSWLRVPFTEHTGADGDPKEPGTYTARVPTSSDVAGPYLIVVDARRARETLVAAVDPLYRDPYRPELDRETVEVPDIRRRTVLTAVADASGRLSEEPIAGFNREPPWVPTSATGATPHGG